MCDIPPKNSPSSLPLGLCTSMSVSEGSYLSWYHWSMLSVCFARWLCKKGKSWRMGRERRGKRQQVMRDLFLYVYKFIPHTLIHIHVTYKMANTREKQIHCTLVHFSPSHVPNAREKETFFKIRIPLFLSSPHALSHISLFGRPRHQPPLPQL